LTPVKLGSSTVTHIKNGDGATVTDALIGSTVHDSATVTGTQAGGTPTGNVTFQLYATQNCSGDHTDEVVALSSGTANSSDTTVPTTGLSYKAVYGGNDTYNGSTGDCEPLTPDKLVSSATTTILGPDDETAVTSVDVGTIVHDSVTVTGSGPTPTGTVTFAWFANGLCTGNPLSTSDPLDLVDGSLDASTFTQTAAPAGTYAFQATYSGDDTYLGVKSDCEPLTSNPLQPTIGTTPSAGGQLGVVINDSATLAGGYQPTGTITFKLFPPSNATCNVDGAAAVYTQVVAVDGNGVYNTSPGYTSIAAGTYHWVARYSGDANNNSVASACADEPVTVTNPPNNPPPPPPPPPPPVVDVQITKTGTPNPGTTGTNITWTMVVHNNGPDGATGVNLADPLPAGTTFVSVSTTQGTCAGGALITCQLGNIANGGTVTITLVTTATTAGTLTNTGTVVANESETTTSNNTASASVVINNPPGVFKPPKPKPAYCAALMVSPKSLFAGRHAVLTMRVFKHAKAVAGVKVRINGAGLLIVTHATNSKGVVTRGVFPKKAGIVTFRPVAQKSCKNTRIGVIGVFTPPVTG
jgi:uncharacterized repeat protein (TIGR01451 family)